jgi:hypothetical protein
MGRSFCLPVVACLAACVAMAQTPPDETAEVASARQLLSSSDWAAKALGAFQAGRLHDGSLLGSLGDELRKARDLSYAGKESEQYAYVQSLFDALIVGGVSAPSDVVWPSCRDRVPECLILLARCGADETNLLSLRGVDLHDPEWLAVNNLLLGMHSGQFLANMIAGAEAAHDFVVSDPGPGTGSGGSYPIGWGLPPDVVRRFPQRFPPIGVYELLTRMPGAGDVLLTAGRHPVYYRRTVVPAGGSVQWPGHIDGYPDRHSYCIDFLADASGMDPSAVWGSFAGSTFVIWTDQNALQVKMEEALSVQEAGIRKLVESAKQAGFHNIAPMHVRIVTRILDHRTKSHDPLPTLDYQWFLIE